MADIKDIDLVRVSNNSRLTKETVDMLNEQLDDSSKKLFLEWMRLVGQKQEGIRSKRYGSLR